MDVREAPLSQNSSLTISQVTLKFGLKSDTSRCVFHKIITNNDN